LRRDHDQWTFVKRKVINVPLNKQWYVIIMLYFDVYVTKWLM
jgi:hypothetical protein